ncbi:hypothetical protein [Streptomyces sp. NPDC088258]|uniref:hypothetical protein n=1 Tax=Streptomyces sp. NPDC088258 TaxID=3365849 RepID=UPI003805C1D6
MGLEDAGDLGEVRGLPRGRGAEDAPCAVGAGGQVVEDLLRGALAAVSAEGLVGGALVLAGGGLDLLDRGISSTSSRLAGFGTSTIAVSAWSAMRAAGATTERTTSVMVPSLPRTG